MKYHKPFSLRTRINFMFAAFMILLIVALYGISNYSIGLFKNYVVDNNVNALDTVINRWETKLDTVGGHLMDIAYQTRDELKALVISSHTRDVDYVLGSGEIRRRFLSDLNYELDMSACFVYVTKHDDLIVANRGNSDRYNGYSELIKEQCTDLGVWRLVRYEANSNTKPEALYSLIKTIDIGYDTYIGTILDVSDIVDSIKALNKQEHARIQAVGDDGAILFDTGEDLQGPHLVQISRELSYSGITFIVFIREDRLLRQIPYYNYAVLIYVSVIALLLLISYHVILYRAVSKDVLDKDLQVKLAQLRQLQAQINPHFFMNSLNLVLSLSALQNYETVSELIYHLSDYFRFTMHNTNVTTTISDELKRVRTYLEIHKIRFPQNLDYNFIVPDDTLNIEIPPLTIQPLIENSIVHGFSNSKNTTFVMTVEIEKNETELILSINDNGKGFTQDSLAYIREHYKIQGDTEHIGIQNIYWRLNMFFDGSVEMEFDNNPDGGAVVKVKIPVRKIEWRAHKNV